MLCCRCRETMDRSERSIIAESLENITNQTQGTHRVTVGLS